MGAVAYLKMENTTFVVAQLHLQVKQVTSLFFPSRRYVFICEPNFVQCNNQCLIFNLCRSILWAQSLRLKPVSIWGLYFRGKVNQVCVPVGLRRRKVYHQIYNYYVWAAYV